MLSWQTVPVLAALISVSAPGAMDRSCTASFPTTHGSRVAARLQPAPSLRLVASLRRQVLPAHCQGSSEGYGRSAPPCGPSWPVPGSCSASQQGTNASLSRTAASSGLRRPMLILLGVELENGVWRRSSDSSAPELQRQDGAPGWQLTCSA